MSKITQKESLEQKRMASNMQRFLSETKEIPCKVVNIHEGEKEVVDKEEVDKTPEYQVVCTKGKGATKFEWVIKFDRDDIDDKGLPTRLLILENKITFEVSQNPHLFLILSRYRVKKEAKKVAPKAKKPEAVKA